MKVAVKFICALLILAAGEDAAAQAISTVSEGPIENLVHNFALAAGDSAFAAAIANGEVNIVAGEMPGGVNAYSIPAPQCIFGDEGAALIVVMNGGSPAIVCGGAAHEWTHISNDHDTEDHGDDESARQGQACQEAEALCASLLSMWSYAL